MSEATPRVELVTEPAAPAGDGTVQIAYLHPHKVSHSFMESLLRLTLHDLSGPGLTAGTGGPFMISCPLSALVESRNVAVTRWLDETPHEWLLFIDTDMGFEPDALDRLIAVADPLRRPVVGALTFSAREMGADGMGGRRIMPVPVMFVPGRTPAGHVGFTPRWRWPEGAVVQVAGTGAAFLLIHRSIAERMRSHVESDGSTWGDRWFERVKQGDGRWVSEDLSFCWRLSKLKIPLFVHTGVRTTHHKEVWLSDLDYTPPLDAPPLEAYGAPGVDPGVDPAPAPSPEPVSAGSPNA